MNENRNPVWDMTNLLYDPAWHGIFESLKTILFQAYPQAVSIEHVGSTAIPGMLAKPRIDLDLVIKNEAEIEVITAVPTTLGYYPQGNLGRPGREAFGRKDDQVPYSVNGISWMKHNLYVCPQNSPVLREHILFRDYLRSHPDVAEEYKLLKENLSTEFRHDQDSYVVGKTAFVTKVLQLANSTEIQ